MKRGGFLKRTKSLQSSAFGSLSRATLKRSKLRVEGKSHTAETKKRIQALARQIVILRDGGCILRNTSGIPRCNGYTKTGQLIYQADHLIPRNHSSTYADTRLIVCVCLGHHGWKSLGSNARKAQYDALIKTLLSPERVRLWEACEADSWKPTPTSAMDWRLHEAALRVELSRVG